MLLIAEGSVLGLFGMAAVLVPFSIAMMYFGRVWIRTKRAPAKRLEKVFAEGDGHIHGGMAVMKGYIMLISGVVFLLMAIAIILLGIYMLIFGPINLAR